MAARCGAVRANNVAVEAIVTRIRYGLQEFTFRYFLYLYCIRVGTYYVGEKKKRKQVPRRGITLALAFSPYKFSTLQLTYSFWYVTTTYEREYLL